MLARAVAILCLASCLCVGQPLPFEALGGPLPGVGTVIAQGDFDLNGTRDVLRRAGVSFNDGHGLFSEPVSLGLPPTVQPLAAVDVNGDGRPDIISTDGTQVPRIDLVGPALSLTQLPVGSLPALVGASGGVFVIERVTSGDVDLDGDLDLLVGGRDQLIYGAVPTAPVLLLNNGAASFTIAPPTMFASSAGTALEDLVDLDGDGDLDALVYCVFGAPLGVCWMANNVTIFGPPVAISLGPTDGWWGIGDFDGDGVNDLAVPTPINLGIHLGTPAGPGAAVTATISAARASAADLDLDGRDELIVETVPGRVETYTVSSTGIVAASPTQTFEWTSLVFAALRPFDVDGDGDLDVIASRGVRGAILMSDGAGSCVLEAAPEVLGTNPLIGDLDADGDPDIVALLGGVVASRLNDGDGRFTLGPTVPLPFASGTFIGHAFDHDGDGDVDLYLARDLTRAYSQTGQDLLLTNVNGTFSSSGTFDDGPVIAIRSVDVDADGDLDLLLGRRNLLNPGNGSLASSLRLLRNTGGGFAPAVTIANTGATYDLEVGDFDGDGDPDVFQANDVPFGGPLPSRLLLNDGTGAFMEVLLPLLSGRYCASGDLDGDLLPDLVIDTQVWFNTGGGTFAAGPSLSSLLTAPTELVDVDADGDLDLVESPATVFLNAGGGVFAPPVSPGQRMSVSPTALVVPASAIADFDRDGDLDVIGPDRRLYQGLRRQIHPRQAPRSGRPFTLDLFGPPATGYALWASATPADIPAQPYGTLLIDPWSAVLVQAGSFSPPGAPSPGRATLDVVLPNLASWVGSTVYWQMIDNVPRFSNRATTTVMGY